MFDFTSLYDCMQHNGYGSHKRYKVLFRRVPITNIVMAKQEVLYDHNHAAGLVTQRANRLRSIMLSCVACPSLRYFYALLHTQNDFQKK